VVPRGELNLNNHSDAGMELAEIFLNAVNKGFEDVDAVEEDLVAEFGVRGQELLLRHHICGIDVPVSKAMFPETSFICYRALGPFCVSAFLLQPTIHFVVQIWRRVAPRVFGGTAESGRDPDNGCGRIG